MNIALFGGAFDPPHLGHYQVTQQLLDRQLVDEVWYVPVRQHPFSKPLVASDHHRLEMLKRMIEPGVRVETYELDSAEISYAYYTLQALTKKYPQHTFCWVIGSDNVASFHKWGFYEELLSQFVVFVYPREGHSPISLLKGMGLLADMPVVTVSSTQVREKIKQHQSIESLVAPAVAVYIAEQGLYR